MIDGRGVAVDPLDAAIPDSVRLPGDLQAQWARVRTRLRDEFGEAAFRSWLKSMTLTEVVDGRARIGLPTRFLRDWVAQHYVDKIRALWNVENPAVADVEVFVAPAGTALRSAPVPAPDETDGFEAVGAIGGSAATPDVAAPAIAGAVPAEPAAGVLGEPGDD